MAECVHSNVVCLNPYELIRKYQCASCGHVMMCSCDEDFARKYLPHQISFATELTTQRRIPVTLGFQPKICNQCRGLPEESHPKAELYGRSSKVARYYWREIYLETVKLFSAWAEANGHSDWLKAQREFAEEYKSIEKDVTAYYEKQHQISPKYEYQEESPSEVLASNQVNVIDLDGTYIRTDDKRVRLLDGKDLVSAEEFVARYFERSGYEVLFSESVPFHVIFGVFTWLLLQDPSDPRQRVNSFPSRGTEQPEMITTFLPEDFGTPTYALRRTEAVARHFEMIEAEHDLMWLFDYWLEPSEDLRQYLWAHNPEKVAIARQIVASLPADVILRIIRYLLGDYWRRYCGWPDLILLKEGEFLFVEVKASKDKLREDQKNWIRGNRAELSLPFQLVKIHKKQQIDRIS